MAERKRRTRTAPPLALRIVRLHAKLAISVAVGIAVALLSLLLPGPLPLAARLLIGWNVGVALYLYLTITTMLAGDVARIRKRAAEEDEGAFVILVLSIAATIASLVAVIIVLGGSKQDPNGQTFLQIFLAMTTILLSWSFVHTIFSLYYAHEYYGEGRDKKIGGLNFPSDPAPDYRDFLYFSLVIGMTSQTSDTDITSKAIRRMAALHGFLSFFFNLTVLALTVNMVSNLI